jgi:LuxR family maltose regulon positive regulatory protein
MSSTLLSTKLKRPSLLRKQLPRPFLTDKLQTGLDAGRQLTLVSAPAGFGKTTCVSDWVQTLSLPGAWLSLDAADDDPGRFFAYLIAALQQIDGAVGQLIQGMLASGQLPPADVIGTVLSNDIAQVDGRFLLILDDFQVIQDSFILDVLRSLVINQPPPLHLVLLTREEPPLPLARLRANNQMTEIRAADLRLSPQETAVFLDDIMDISLPAADQNALAEKTEGWVVGLQLAGFSLRNRDNPAQFIANLRGSHRHILRYLTEEVLNQQPDPIQNFLLQTAILDKLTGPLCDAVTGGSNGRVLLEQLYNDNLFLIPLDDDQQWYRYHQLFADLLRDRLQAQQPQQITVLHQRAGRWYAEANQPVAAVDHALAGGDYETAVNLIETHAMDLLTSWRVKTIKGWMHALPQEWAVKSPRTNLAFAWLYLPSGDFHQAQPYIARLQTMFADDLSADFDIAVRAEWLALRATLLGAQGQVTESVELAQEALTHLPSDNVFVRSLIYSGIATAYKQMNDYARALAQYEHLIQFGQASNNLVSELMGATGLILYAMERGELRFAFEMASRYEARIEQSQTFSPISAAIYGELGAVHFYRYQIPDAHAYFAKSTAVSALSGYSDAAIFHHLIRSRLALIDGDLETAVAEMQAAVELTNVDAPAAINDEVIAQQVRVYLAQNRPEAAESLLAPHGFNFQPPFTWPALSSDQPLSRMQSLLALSALRILLYQVRTRPEAVDQRHGLALAERFLTITRHHHYLPMVLDSLLIRAQLHDLHGENTAAQADMTAALTLAEPENSITQFLEGGFPVAVLLSRSEQWGTVSPAFVKRILDAFPERVRIDVSSEMGADQAAGNQLVEPLSKREREVLQLIADGLTNRQIADRLTVTLHTIKKHTSNIYTKLGVRSRTQAVAAARDQQLL